ncbi:flavodoxin [Spiroplasma turonicum]|uniref:Flavodoxin-like domain-containing protein n=1 Tax=Spiroplasma turonicum TaxID=216946 RepID=A0A0K1P6R2_9MOLU|nr:flavodoxin [Spiroplasma turonicum]AKU79909.1 hypothetical protein STURON_00663 [Spiroplasma turonicum]ALX70921.1 flavodoxin [Spiroplasma turonicum]
MKKLLKLFSVIFSSNIFLINTISCSNKSEQEYNLTDNTRKDTIVIYFSWSNNTKSIANYISSKLNLDKFELKRKKDYPKNYNELSLEAKNEAINNLRPELKETPDFIKNYKYIFLGFPIWWHLAPMIIGSFLNYYNLDNIHILPFMTSSGYLEEHRQRAIQYLNDNSTKGTIIEKEIFSTNLVNVENWIKDIYVPLTVSS